MHYPARANVFRQHHSRAVSRDSVAVHAVVRALKKDVSMQKKDLFAALRRDEFASN